MTGKKSKGALNAPNTEPNEQPDDTTVPVSEPGQAPGESDAVIEPAPGEVEDAVQSLGDALRRDEGATGGYELGEEAHESAIDRMAALGDGLELDEASLVARVRDFLLEIIKARPKPWSATSAAEQRDVAGACDQLAEGLIREIVEVVRSGGRPAVRVLLTKVTLGDDTQIVGKLKALAPEEEDEAVMMLHHARGKHVLLTVASVDDYKQEHRAAHTDVEEPALPFESDDHPDDDSDLVEAGGDEPGPHEPDRGAVVDQSGEERIVLKTGDTWSDDSIGDLEIRVNLKTGMVEGKAAGADDFDHDLREATPDELAAERERVADFEAEPA